MYVYCLFCQTQKCKAVAAELERRGIRRAFSPLILKHERVRGRNMDRLMDLLPGYVFAFSGKELKEPGLFYNIPGVIRRIGEAENGYALTGNDRGFAMGLYDKNGTVGQITLYKAGDTIRVDDPLFAGVTARITQMDYRKQRARLEYQFAGVTCYTWIACELISKNEDKDPV